MIPGSLSKPPPSACRPTGIYAAVSHLCLSGGLAREGCLKAIGQVSECLRLEDWLGGRESLRRLRQTSIMAAFSYKPRDTSNLAFANSFVGYHYSRLFPCFSNAMTLAMTHDAKDFAVPPRRNSGRPLKFLKRPSGATIPPAARRSICKKPAEFSGFLLRKLHIVNQLGDVCICP